MDNNLALQALEQLLRASCLPYRAAGTDCQDETSDLPTEGPRPTLTRLPADIASAEPSLWLLSP